MRTNRARPLKQKHDILLTLFSWETFKQFWNTTYIIQSGANFLFGIYVVFCLFTSTFDR